MSKDKDPFPRLLVWARQRTEAKTIDRGRAEAIVRPDLVNRPHRAPGNNEQDRG